MAVPRSHTWVAGEILLASDLNSEFNNIVTNGTAVAFPATAAVSMAGFALNFDVANTMALTAGPKGLNLSSTTAINDVFTTVASATTPDIWTAVGGVVNYTGTVTATGFVAAPQAGARRTLVCAGAAPFTAGANVIIDGYASGTTYTAAAGDKVHLIAVTTTQFRLSPVLAATVQALSDGATINWDASLGPTATVTTAGNRTFAAPTNLRNGGVYTLTLTQDATGGRTHTFNAVFKTSNGTPFPQPQSALGLSTVYQFTSDGTNLFLQMGGYLTGDLRDYAGTVVPAGFLQCDGTTVSRTTQAALFAIISTTWGAGDGSTTFNLPDFRGRVAIGSGTGTLSEAVAFGSVSTAGDTFTVTSNNTKWITGQPVQLTTTSGLPAPLATVTTYYVIRASATTIQLATTLANAQNSTQIDITTQGAGTHTLTGTLTARTVGEVGGEEGHAMSLTELLAHSHGVTDPGHTHTSRIRNAPAGASTTAVEANADPGDSTVTSTSNTTGITINSAGGNAAMNVMQSFAVALKLIKT